jgi:lysosomal acid lipase/cholesteryl ester hydrolase
MALFDIPVIIDYILDQTKQLNLFYVGHSMGCSAFLASMSMFPEYNTKIKTFIGLAPAVYIGHSSVPFDSARPVLLYQQVRTYLMFSSDIQSLHLLGNA